MKRVVFFYGRYKPIRRCRRYQEQARSFQVFVYQRTIQICRKCQIFSFCTPTRVLPQRQLKETCGRGYDGLLSTVQDFVYNLEDEKISFKFLAEVGALNKDEEVSTANVQGFQLLNLDQLE